MVHCVETHLASIGLSLRYSTKL